MRELPARLNEGCTVIDVRRPDEYDPLGHKARGQAPRSPSVEKTAHEFIINARLIELTRDKLLMLQKRIGAKPPF